jgi:hypothetical protein
MQTLVVKVGEGVAMVCLIAEEGTPSPHLQEGVEVAVEHLDDCVDGLRLEISLHC